MSKSNIIQIRDGIKQLNYSTLIKNLDNPYCKKELENRITPFLDKISRRTAKKKAKQLAINKKKGRL